MAFNVLVADPSDAQWTAITKGVRRYRPEAAVLRVKDGEQAVRFLFERGLLTEQPQTPSLVLLSADLPIVPSETIVAQVRQHPRTREIPIIVVCFGWQDSDGVPALEQQDWIKRQQWLLMIGTDRLERGVAEAARQLCAALAVA